MYSVQCHFCSMSNPADAKFCSGCMVQLNLAPCPHCDEVNELSALVCHACKGELLQAVVERASGDSEQAGTFPVRIGIDTPAPVATRSVVGGGLFGSRRETYGTEAADSGQAERSKLPAQHARIGLGQHKSLSAKQAMVPLRRALGVRTRIPVSFSRLRVVAAVVGVGVVLAIGVLVYAPSRAPLHVTSPAVTTSPGNETASIQEAFVPAIPYSRRGPLPPVAPLAQQPASTERESTSAFVEVKARVAPQDGEAIVSKPVKPAPSRASEPGSVAAGAAAKATESAAACTAGVAALGLCPSQPGQAQPAIPIRPAIDVARGPVKERATGGCNKAAVALGLCE